MKEAFELIRKRLSEESFPTHENYSAIWHDTAINIVSEVEAECGNGWVPCSERLPSEEETKDCASFVVTKRVRDKFSTIDFCLFGTEGEWLVRENEEVLAWMPLPEPYKEVKQ